MKVLVSGASSGLGKYLKDFFAADVYVRGTHAPTDRYDAVIHCAFNLAQNVPESDMATYERDTLGLTNTLLSVPHRHFVFISTVDVYPKNGKTHREDEAIAAEQSENLYGKTKLRCEHLVTLESEYPLILRPTALLGPSMRPNSLTKILSGENPKLTLSGDSEFNYVLHEDIAAFINHCLHHQLSGTYNIAASKNITLAEVCKQFAKPATFGEYVYRSGTIDNSKAATLLPAFHQDSMENVWRLINAH